MRGRGSGGGNGAGSERDRTVRRAAGLALLLAVALCRTAAPAQFAQTEYRAADGTTYQLLRVLPPLPTGAERERITSIIGSSYGAGGCNKTGSAAGQITSAIAGALTPGQIPHPLDFVRRTAILLPASISAVAFDSGNAGRLTLGSGANAINVCQIGSDCPGGSAPLTPITDSSGGVPAACLARSVGSACDGDSRRDLIAFGVPASGNPAVCNDGIATTQTFVCAPEPADGFSLTPGQALVIVYHGSLSGVGFSTGAAGFGIDTNGSNQPGCAAGSIVNAAARLDNDPGLPAPTATPTATVTYTATSTRTASYTATPTATATATATPTATPVCGDGMRQGAEQCDDGNVQDGDCCSSTCRFEAPGAPCAGDGNTCTRDQCTGTGICAHPPEPNGLTCEDGNRCTTAEHCIDGACAGAVPVVCNDDDPCTTDRCDAGTGCRFEVHVESPECGSCDDGIDNDGNAFLDGEEPACATLNDLQRFAIVGTATDGVRSLRLAREARILQPSINSDYARGTRGGACGVDMSASIGVLVTGSMALEGSAHFSGGRPPVRILAWFANDDPSPRAVQTGQTLPLVGPPSMCTDGTSICRATLDCPSLQQCELQLPMTYPAQPWVDRTGTATDFVRCQAALAAVPTTEQLIFALPRTQSVGAIELRAGQHGTIDLEHPDGQNVVDIDALRIGQDGALTIRGADGADTSAAVVVLRVAGAFRIGTRSTVTLEGGLAPDHVIWAVSGAGRFVRISSRSTFAGTLFAAKRPKISIGAFTAIDGSLIGKRIRMGRESRVNHSPFSALLEGVTQNSPNLAVRAVRLQSSSTQRSNGALRINAIVDDSDTGTFADRLLASVVSLAARDAQTFNAAVALTGCVRREARVFFCRSADRNTRATIKRLRDDPNIYTLTVQRHGLSVTSTGSAQPTGPVTVTMQQGALQRAGQIATCRRRGVSGLTCRTR